MLEKEDGNEGKDKRQGRKAAVNHNTILRQL